LNKQLHSSQLARKTLALVLAGGRGSRLLDLTQRRAKPAVFFGGKFRIIDFALSNCVNSGIRRISVLTQYKSHSLIRHLQRGWSFLRGELNETLEVLPASQRMDDDSWYRGTADAVFQNLDIIRTKRPQFVLILAGDHVYKMDYSIMLEDHVSSGRACTVGCIEVPRQEASAFGVMGVDSQRLITSFEEKPAEPHGLPDRPDRCLASMGIYIFNADYLYRLLEADLEDAQSCHDFGKDIIPKVVKEQQALAHPFAMSCVRSSEDAENYWRDVGTLDGYWAANLDLACTLPQLDIYDNDWPVWTHQIQMPPAKFVPDHAGHPGVHVNTIVASGCVISGSVVRNSVLFPNVRIESFAQVEQSVVLPGSTVRSGCRIRKAVVDCGCDLPAGLVIGEDPVDDARRFQRTESGVVLVTPEMLGALV
jgi:glucose-1-phosphate adenylyltransferase